MKNIDNVGNILHVDKVNYAPFSVVKQEDSFTITVDLFKNGQELDVTGQTIELAAKRADNVVVQQVEGFTIDTNKVTIELRNNVIAAPGIVQCELNIKDSVGAFTTSNFTLRVSEKILGEDSLNASDNIQALEKVKNDFVTSSTKLKDDFITSSKLLEKEFADNNRNALNEFNTNATGIVNNLEEFATNKIVEFNRETAASLNIFNNTSKKEIDDFKNNSGAAINKFNTDGSKQLADQRAEYESLKDIITSENPTALLQDQINKNTTRSTSNKTRIDKIENVLPVWQDHTGDGNITVNDSFEGEVRNLIIKGKTIGGYNVETGQSDSIMSTGEAEGNKLILRSCGKNLWDLRRDPIGGHYERLDNGFLVTKPVSQVAAGYLNYKLNKNSSYTLSIEFPDGNGYYCIEEDGIIVAILYGNDEKKIVRNFNTKSGNILLRFGIHSDKNTVPARLLNPQLEEGTLASKYEPYIEDKKEILLPCPHRGLERKQNEYNSETGKYKENIDKITLDGRNYTFFKWTNKTWYLPFNKIAKNGLRGSVISDKFTNRSFSEIFGTDIEGICTQESESRILINTNEADLNAWLQQNPVTVVYELAEPTVHNIEKMSLKTYDDTTHIIQENEVAGEITCKAKVSLSSQNNRLKLENESLKKDLNAKSEYFHSNDLTLTHSDLELDFRMMEIEFALDIPLNIQKGKVNNMAARTPYEMMRVLIIGGVYDRDDLEYKISVYQKRGRMTQSEADELKALMDAREVINKN